MIVAGSFSKGNYWLLALLVAALWCLQPRVANAHAELLSAAPAAGSAIASAPNAVRLTFTEAVDPGLSSIVLLRLDGRAVPLGAFATGRTDPKVLAADLPAAETLEAGTYTVVWSAYSAEDDHTSSGSFSFSVGTGTAPVHVDRLGTDTMTAAIIGKWLELAGVILLTGLGVFAATTRSRASIQIGPNVNAFAGLAVIGLLGALISLRARETAISGKRLVGWVDSETLSGLLSSTYGQAWVARFVALLVMLAIALWGSQTNRQTSFVAIAGLGAIGISSIAISGHAGSVDPSWAAVAVDMLHMAGAAIWLGGLLGLLLIADPPVGSDGYRELLRAQGNRFLAAILLILGAGVVSAWWHIGGRRGLTGSDYGQTLLIKVALVVTILGIAFYNRRVLQHVRARLAWTPFAVGLELVLGAAVLLLSADLSQTPPANRPLPVQIAARALELDASAGSGSSSVQLSGILTGDPSDWITLEVSPPTDLQRVIVRSSLKDAETGLVIGDRFDAEAIVDEPGIYRFPSGRLGVAGTWELEVAVRRAGVEDEIVTIAVDTTRLAGRGTSFASDAWTGFRPTAHTALALGLAVLMLLVGLGGLRRITGFEPLASGFLLAASLLIAGGFLVSAAQSLVPMTPGHGLPNRATTDPDTLTYAGELYRLNCASCHGTDGKGAGAGNLAHLHGEGADLTDRISVEQADGDLRWWVAHGMPGTEMPAFSPALSGDDQWKLVLYLRQLQEAAKVSDEAEE